MYGGDARPNKRSGGRFASFELLLFMIERQTVYANGFCWPKFSYSCLCSFSNEYFYTENRVLYSATWVRLPNETSRAGFTKVSRLHERFATGLRQRTLLPTEAVAFRQQPFVHE